MNAEIKAACEWWAKSLSGGHFQDNGDPLQSVAATLLRSEVAIPTEDQLQAFRLALAERIHAAIVRQDIWHVDNPLRGGALEGRCISVDYGPEPILREAAELAGINRNRFPIKTVMWLSPGLVKVACGYRAAETVIYPPS
jgi:hypothetical protein